MQTRDYIREFFMIFFIRRTIILAIAVGALAVGVLVVALVPPVYQAKGALVIKGAEVLEDPTAVGDMANDEVNPVSETDLFSEMEILSSFSVAKRATEMLAAENKFGLAPDNEERLRWFASRIGGNLNTSIVPRSEVIRATLNWRDPADAETILSKVFDGYRQQRQAVYNPEQTKDFFRTQMESYRDTLRAQEARLLQITDGRRLDEIEKQIDANVALIADLERELANLEGDHLEQSKFVAQMEDSLRSEDTAEFYTAIDNVPLGDFAREVQNLYIEEAKVLQTYRPSTKKVAAIQKQLQRMQGMLRQEAARIVAMERARLETMGGRVEMINAKLATLRTENRGLNQLALQAKQLEREISSTEETMQRFDDRYQEASIKSDMETDLFAVGVVETPQAPRAPVFPDPKTVLPIALGLGLLLGLTVGFLLEFFDHRFKRPEDLHNFAGVPCIFSIPDYA